MPEIVVKAPEQCSVEELDLFRTFLLKRPEINKTNLDVRIMRSRYLSFAYVDKQPVGIGSVKTATKGFRHRILEGLGVSLYVDIPRYELGWLYIDSRFRGAGIGSGMIHPLVEAMNREDLFSLTATGNKVMQSLLVSRGFELSGEVDLPGRNPYLFYLRSF